MGFSDLVTRFLRPDIKAAQVKTSRAGPMIAWSQLGHTRTVRGGQEITAQQADQLLDEDLRLFERSVARLVTVPLNDNQFSALVCFAFNVGVGNLENSTLLKLLNRGWYEQVPAQLMRWNRVNGEVFGGLARRRAAEARLWNRD